MAATPFSGTLSDSGERVTLRKPSPDTGSMTDVMAEVDWVRYGSSAPWADAAGSGSALLRLAPGAPNPQVSCVRRSQRLVDSARQYAIGPEPLNWGSSAAVCSPTCKNSGLCVRADTCDCSGTPYTGATCDSAPLSCGDGMVQTANGEECDGGDCCNALCKYKASGTSCRAAVAGGCDVAEVCTGSSGLCPVDAFAAGGLTCRPAAGVCDVAETVRC